MRGALYIHSKYKLIFSHKSYFWADQHGGCIFVFSHVWAPQIYKYCSFCTETGVTHWWQMQRWKINLVEGRSILKTILSVRKSTFFFCFYQASELSQLDPGEGTSVSLVRAQEWGGDCSRSMFPRRRVSRAAGEWPAGWPFWLSSSCTRKLM